MTKYAKIPQFLHIDKGVVDMPGVMQRQVPRIQTVFEDYGNPDQPGDQARRVPTDSIHRQVCRSACGVAATGPSFSDGEQTVDQPGDQACRIPAETVVHRQGYCRYACGDAATGPSYSDFVEECGSPAGAVRRDSCGCACDLADQPGDQAGRDPADSVRRQGCRHTCGDGMTGPSVSDSAEDRESPAGAARERMHVRIVDVPVLHVALQERTLKRVHEQIVDVPVPHGAQPMPYFPRTQYMDKVVDLPVVMQRMVLRIQTGLKTVEAPPA